MVFTAFETFISLQILIHNRTAILIDGYRDMLKLKVMAHQHATGSELKHPQKNRMSDGRKLELFHIIVV
jgi:hypothetical protein